MSELQNERERERESEEGGSWEGGEGEEGWVGGWVGGGGER